ncbi:MAG: queuosine precursor transporter [Candidatus Levybacteria bacterium]|nr:queuosine precursor transporter [Candidatus Levybacteria bacterium]MBP9815073.1 queuosine precursor transporter [Candidatus Levybacteria bacterium]
MINVLIPTGKMDLLVSVYIFCIVASELMGAKTFPLVNILGYQLNASIAIFLFPFIFTINDIVAEVYGKERARSVVRSGIFIVFLLFLFTILATSLPPSMRFTRSESAYDTIFSFSTRLAAASLIALIISEFTDVYIFLKIKKKLGHKALWFRNNISNVIAQLCDTVLFITLAFYALDKPVHDNIIFLSSIILPYWLLKCFASIIETPFVYLGVKWLREKK